VLAEGASVTITVSLGKESSSTVDVAPVTTWTLTAPELPAGYSSGKVKIELRQNVNGSSVTTTVFEGELKSDELPYAISIRGATGVDTGEIVLYLDGNLLKSYTISF